MSRRIAAVVIALVAALTLSSCGGTSAKPDVVAKVGDAEFTQDDMSTLLNTQFVQKGLNYGTPDGDTVSMTQADGIIGMWVILEAITQSGIADLSDASTATPTMQQDFVTELGTLTGTARDAIVRRANFAVQNNAGKLDEQKLIAAVQAADVWIDSRYGYWDPTKLQVTAFGETTTSSAAA